MTWVAASLMIVLLWIFLRPRETPKSRYPTIEDIRRKYPKRLSDEQLRKQARAKEESEAKRKQEIIDRNIREVRATEEKRSVKSRYSNPKYQKLLTMLNGDLEAAERLISAYGVDRAIADLERDRRFN